MNADALKELAAKNLPPDGQREVAEALQMGDSEAVRKRFHYAMASDIDHGWPPSDAARVLEEVDGLLAA